MSAFEMYEFHTIRRERGRIQGRHSVSTTR
jgi:hypothetical protein